mmetsp:Transcript_7314/g.16757  ORF Transcript_7314/g.16757 Transcript_7314/m.16757 type:complete len:200 (-) Transcript_7314:131-730(-)
MLSGNHRSLENRTAVHGNSALSSSSLSARGVSLKSWRGRPLMGGEAVGSPINFVAVAYAASPSLGLDLGGLLGFLGVRRGRGDTPSSSHKRVGPLGDGRAGDVLLLGGTLACCGRGWIAGSELISPTMNDSAEWTSLIVRYSLWRISRRSADSRVGLTAALLSSPICRGACCSSRMANRVCWVSRVWALKVLTSTLAAS